jgi:hypothetical protein
MAPCRVTTVQKVEVAVTVKGNSTIPYSSARAVKGHFEKLRLLLSSPWCRMPNLVGTIGSLTIKPNSMLYTTGQGFEISPQKGTENFNMHAKAPNNFL